MAKKSDMTLTELRALIKDFYPNLSMKEFNALTKGAMDVKKDMKAKGGVSMKKKTKYMAKGGMKKTKYMAKGGMKKTKYMSKGGMKKTKYMSKGGMKKTKYMSRGGAARRK